MEQNKPTTFKEIAKLFGVSEKTARKDRKLAIAGTIIEDAVGEELSERFLDIFNTKNKNRKNGISDQQLISLSKQSPEIIQRAVNEIIADPDNCKSILRKLMQSDEKTMVILPLDVGRYYEQKASEKGISKGEYIRNMLIFLCIAMQEDEQEEGE